MGILNPGTLSRQGQFRPASDGLLLPPQRKPFPWLSPSISITAPIVSLGNSQFGNMCSMRCFCCLLDIRKCTYNFTRVKIMVLPISRNVYNELFTNHCPHILIPSPLNWDYCYTLHRLYTCIQVEIHSFLCLTPLSKFNYFEIYWCHRVHS